MKKLLLILLLTNAVPSCFAIQFTGSSKDSMSESSAADAKGVPDNLSSDDRKLIESARCGNIEFVKKQLAFGANVNAQDAEGGTALMYAAYKGQVDVVKKQLILMLMCKMLLVGQL